MTAFRSAIQAGVHAWRCEQEMSRYQAKLGAWAVRDPLIEGWALRSAVCISLYTVISAAFSCLLGG